MAAAGNRRVNSRTAKNSYIEGNTVRSMQAVPQRKEEQAPRRRRKVSRRIHRNRSKALQMSKGYVLFLGIICTAILITCVQFLRLKSNITAQSKEVAALESELNQIKAENDAFYSETLASVDLNHVREVAIKNLGMTYPNKEQVMYYSTNGSNYVRQYQEVPDLE